MTLQVGYFSFTIAEVQSLAEDHFLISHFITVFNSLVPRPHPLTKENVSRQEARAGWARDSFRKNRVEFRKGSRKVPDESRIRHH